MWVWQKEHGERYGQGWCFRKNSGDGRKEKKIEKSVFCDCDGSGGNDEINESQGISFGCGSGKS